MILFDIIRAIAIATHAQRNGFGALYAMMLYQMTTKIEPKTQAFIEFEGGVPPEGRPFAATAVSLREWDKVLETKPVIPTEQQDALEAARGAWAIIRKGKQNAFPKVHRFKGDLNRQEKNARAAWARLDVREGWASLVDPTGKTMARQSGPFLRTRW